ncbi:ATP-binding cassette domain-containing protein [Rossellomorea vietnamensis]|uniref:ATP-binding cassette domain-containing protein n=1 Tax=Rossellomorea vietnamensis TaxID=218284 RepID=A0A6I6UPI9_9BACI|nr:ATP-binding cassette domain-containing protein [Rossellomorea vietnamensis]
MNVEYGVEVMNVSKKIKEKKIIDNVSFSSKKGEVLGLLGPNGAGKTTIIKMMVGLARITEGDILIEGHSIQKDTRKALGKIGAIVETPTHYEYMSGYNNLKYFSKLYPGVPKERIDEVVELLSLTKSIHKKVHTYSLGMKQRLGLARSILHRPSILILDEPTNGLDPMGIRELRQYVKELAHKHHISVIVSSHLLTEMELLCDRVVMINEGRLLKQNSINHYSFSIDSQQRHLLDYYVDDAETAARIIEEKMPELHPVTVKSIHHFQGVCSNEQAAVLSKSLIMDGIRVYRIESVESSLEDEFMKINEQGVHQYAVNY